MGVWGTGPFENDDARDFTEELQADGVWVLRSALEEVALLDPEGYVAAPSSSRAIAAAEVLERRGGQARAVALAAQHDDPGVVASDLG